MTAKAGSIEGMELRWDDFIYRNSFCCTYLVGFGVLVAVVKVMHVWKYLTHICIRMSTLTCQMQIMN